MKISLLLPLLGAFLFIRANGAPLTIDLGTAGLFAVLAGSTVTNTGPTTINGNVGVSPGTAITGFPPASIGGSGILYSSGPEALQAQSDLAAAYNFAAGEACPHVLTGQDLGGLTLLPGTYCFDSSAQLTGTVTLDGLGVSTSVFIFQVGSSLTTASASVVDLINSANAGNVFWQVGSSATLGTTTSFAGNILALTSISLDTGASINCGRALARNGAVTLDNNNVALCASVNIFNADVPEPGTVGLLGASLLLLGLYRQRKA
jgi:hypothetical protein